MLEYIPLLIALLLLSSFFSSAETAFLSLQRLKLEHYVREGLAGAEAVSRLLKTPRKLLSAILVGNNLVNTGAAIVGGIIAQQVVAGGFGALLAALTVTALLVVFGEVVPKTIALQHNFALSRVYALPMTLWTQVTQPVVALLEGLARAILALLGAAEREEQQVTEAELRMMIGLSAETGTIVEEEAELLTRVFHFGDRQVHEVLVPRTETVWLPRGMTVRDFYKVFAETPHSRFPMYEGDLDHVIGIIGIKDVLRAIALGEMKEDDPVERVLRPAFFVPETKVIAELFREMQAQGHQMAIAVDEWGGTAGIVTIELLLEEMVGRVRDELLPPEEEEIKTIDAGVLEVDGSLSVEEAREELGIDIPEGPYDTVAGFVLSVLGHIPREGEFVILDGHQITVTEMKGLKIESLRITRV